MPNPYSLTVQLYRDGAWHDALTIDVSKPETGLRGICDYGYVSAYIVDLLNKPDTRLEGAASARLPVSWETWHEPHAPAFLLDIIPSGAAGRFLQKRLLHEKPEGLHLDLFLLSRCTPAPIGNLRIKQSVAHMEDHPLQGFSRAEVITRNTGFLEYAYEQGAAIGGATGAGGEAPKLLLAENSTGLLFPDAVLTDTEVTQHWFVKFARNQARQVDVDVLTSEFCYYKAIQMIGLDTVPVEGLALEFGGQPSLWMHRFDRAVTHAGIERRAVESIYSIAGVTEPGAYMDHTQVVQCLVALWQEVGQADQIEDLIAEYLMRDLLNQILGNSDNHCRNMSVIRTAQGIKLAPIYDLAPMVMDPEGVTRTTKWKSPIEIAGNVDWTLACEALSAWANPIKQMDRLRTQAQRFMALPQILERLGLPHATMAHPMVRLGNLSQWLEDRGLA